MIIDSVLKNLEKENVKEWEFISKKIIDYYKTQPLFFGMVLKILTFYFTNGHP